MAEWVAPLIAAAGTALSTWLQNRSQKKQYAEMQEYNKPVNQQKRLMEAGLSPWLMYSQGNPGNMSSPAPADNYGVSEGLSAYTGMVDTMSNQQEYRMRKRIIPLMYEQERQKTFQSSEATSIMADRALQERYAALRAGLELEADFPLWSMSTTDTLKEGTAKAGMRYQMNELKRAMSEANLRRLLETVKSVQFKNEVDAVKAMYARDYGMVGGDWTQGVGALRSIGGTIGSFFKNRGVLNQTERSMLSTYRKFKGQQLKRDENRFLFEQLKP